MVAFAILVYVARRKAIDTRAQPDLAETSLAYTNVQVWQAAEICLSLVTASLPFALRFLRDFDFAALAAQTHGMAKLAIRKSSGQSLKVPSFARCVHTSEVTSQQSFPSPRPPSMIHAWESPIRYSVHISFDEKAAAETQALFHPSQRMAIYRKDEVLITCEPCLVRSHRRPLTLERLLMPGPGQPP